MLKELLDAACVVLANLAVSSHVIVKEHDDVMGKPAGLDLKPELHESEADIHGCLVVKREGNYVAFIPVSIWSA